MIKKFISDGELTVSNINFEHFYCEGHNFTLDFYLPLNNPLWNYLDDLLERKVIIKIEFEKMEEDED